MPPRTAARLEVLPIGEDFDNASSLREIVRGARQCRCGVGHKDGPVEFCYTALGSCEKLREEILNGEYHARKGTVVQIYRPKRRTANAPWFRDRTWQRSMCNNGVYRDLTAGFLFENIACQKGKGQDLAFRILIKFLQELHRTAPGKPVCSCLIQLIDYHILDLFDGNTPA